ncbi:retinal-binding protein-like [Haliotis cracherodii]|uniref:retinal-binding protein-like n=1 Tax=Haliotis cracherodii TaxID=6455 RepID=UPI0039EC21F4
MHRRKYTLAQHNGSCVRDEGEGHPALQKFKVQIQDLLTDRHDDHSLTKWLKARQFDVAKAEHMFRTSMAYREKMKIEDLVKNYTPPEVLQKYLTGGFCGYDKEGSPVRVERYGRLDMKGIMFSCKKLDLEKTKILQCEGTVRDWETQSQKLGRRVDGITVVFDMEGVSSRMMWRPGLQMYLYLVKVLEDNYPEMMKRMFVVNAPRIFPLLYKLCRPLISEEMKNKIHVLGGDFSGVLLEHIDADQLPVFLGGAMKGKDGDPYCSELIPAGGDVPETYYLQSLTNTDNMETTTIPRGDKIILKYEVDTPGSILRWEFKTEGFDISFGVFLLREGAKIPILPLERVNSHMVPEDGSCTCEEAGTYELCFDNSFSWARGKKIQYSVEIVAADDNIETEIDHMIVGDGSWRDLVITDTTVTTRM